MNKTVCLKDFSVINVIIYYYYYYHYKSCPIMDAHWNGSFLSPTSNPVANQTAVGHCSMYDKSCYLHTTPFFCANTISICLQYWHVKLRSTGHLAAGRHVTWFGQRALNRSFLWTEANTGEPLFPWKRDKDDWCDLYFFSSHFPSPLDAEVMCETWKMRERSRLLEAYGFSCSCLIGHITAITTAHFCYVKHSCFWVWATQVWFWIPRIFNSFG